MDWTFRNYCGADNSMEIPEFGAILSDRTGGHLYFGPGSISHGKISIEVEVFVVICFDSYTTATIQMCKYLKFIVSSTKVDLVYLSSSMHAI